MAKMVHALSNALKLPKRRRGSARRALQSGFMSRLLILFLEDRTTLASANAARTSL